MPKPSIFSNRYDQQMKKRKRIIIMIIVAVFIGSGVVFSGVLGKTLSKPKTQAKQENQSNKNEVATPKKEDTAKAKKNTNTPKKENYTVKLSNGVEIKLLYNIVNNEKQYIEVTPKDMKYTISPSKKSICIVENGTQKMMLFDINGNQKEITKLQYISSNGQSFNKDDILKSNPNYIWCVSPMFLDDDNIVYISQLPWFNKADTKYLWKYTISTNTHINNFQSGGEISGNNIEYGNLTPEGLEITVDGSKGIVK